MTDATVRAAFIPFGDIVDVQLPMDFQTEKHRGFAFVEFESAEDATAAIDNMDGAEIYGRTVHVNRAKPAKQGEAGKAGAAERSENASATHTRRRFVFILLFLFM